MILRRVLRSSAFHSTSTGSSLERRFYKMRLPYSKEQLTQACVELVKRNGLKECYIRPIVFSSFGELGVNPLKNPTIGAIACWEWGAYLGDEGMEKGIRCTVSSWARIDGRILPPHAKCAANYANSALTKMDAISAGFDEAILLTLSGHVAEGSGENIFKVKDGEMTTPTMESGILGGITRASVIQIAKDNGIPFASRTSGRRTSSRLTNSSSREPQPCGRIREVDGRTIGDGQYPITKKIQKIYFDAIRGEDRAIQAVAHVRSIDG